jgi:signal transduction histidine kinase
MASRLALFTRAHQRLLSDVAHELRSPIARIQAGVGLLEQSKKYPDHHLKDLEEDVQTMSVLTDELLTFAKAKLLPDALKLVPTNLVETVNRAIRAERQTKTSVLTDIDSTLEVMADPEFLFRSVANTLRNAIRYAGNRGAITVSAVPSGGNVIITIADCGPGIPEDALERVFTPFFRLEAARDRHTGGNGLGFAIVQGCIEACHGSVVCRNRKPSGLEVVITLHAA